MPNPKTGMKSAFGEWETIERTRAETEEALRKRMARAEETVRPDGAMDVTQPDQRLGRPLHVDEMRRRLLKMNSNLRFEVSLRDPSKVGIYMLSQLRNPETKGFDRIFVCGMENGIMPEFSIIHPAEVTMPHPTDPGFHVVREMDVETRGWRTVLAALLKCRLITAPGIEKYFPVNLGTSANWQAKAQPAIEVN